MVTISNGKISISLDGSFQELQSLKDALLESMAILLLPENSDSHAHISHLAELLKALEFNNDQWKALDDISYLASKDQLNIPNFQKAFSPE